MDVVSRRDTVGYWGDLFIVSSSLWLLFTGRCQKLPGPGPLLSLFSVTVVWVSTGRGNVSIYLYVCVRLCMYLCMFMRVHYYVCVVCLNQRIGTRY